MRERVIVGRAVGNRAKECDLRQIQLIRSLVEISFGSRRYAVISIHEIDIIEIEFQYLVLAVFLLKVPGNENFLYLSLPGSAVVKKDTSRQLHCDRTATLRDLPVNYKFLGCTNDRLVVDAPVIVIVLVLDTDDRALE